MKQVKAQKLYMSQVFAEGGEVIPVTLVVFEDLPSDLIPQTPVKVRGISKGKGFAGVVKRYKFAGMPGTHGRSTKGRAPGSIGGTTTPGRVYKGKRMAGRMGGKWVTVQGLTVVGVDPEKKIAKLSGPVPGSYKSRILLTYEPREVALVEPAPATPEQSQEEKPEQKKEAKEPPKGGEGKLEKSHEG
jgi:ribosomal protein L3